MNPLLNPNLPNPKTTILQPAQTADDIVMTLVKEIMTDDLGSLRGLQELAIDEHQQTRLARLLVVEPSICHEVSRVIEAVGAIKAAFDGGCLCGLTDDERVSEIEGDWIYSHRELAQDCSRK
jgi:hypothetical protein